MHLKMLSSYPELIDRSLTNSSVKKLQKNRKPLRYFLPFQRNKKQ